MRANAIDTLLADDVNGNLHTTLFDANPIPTFVLDVDHCVVDFNAAASAFVGAPVPDGVGLTLGDLVHCANASSGSCSSNPDCQSCGIRSSIQAALSGNITTRLMHRFERSIHEQTETVVVLVTAAPVQDGDNILALLIVEDVSEAVRLRQTYCAASA